MITIFTTPKPFKDPHITTIQTNALESWTRIGADVIVFGDSAGAAEICARLGARHVPEIGKNEFGTPLISAMFADAERLGKHDLLCFANADILFTPDVIDVVQRLRQKPRALMIGRRTDLDVKERVEFGAGWEAKMRERARRDGSLHGIGGIDYFAFHRGALGRLPDLAVGRGGWDMYMLFHARARGADVIDATDVLLAVHQNHHYGHVPKGRNWVFEGPEAQRNVALAGGYDHLFDPRDATLRLTPRGFERVRQPLRRRLRKAAVLHPTLGLPLRLARTLLRRIRGGGATPAP